MAKNFKTKFKGALLSSLYWEALKTYSKLEFEKTMEQIKMIDENAHKYLIDSDVSTWANSMFPMPRYGKTTSNAAESINSAIKKFMTLDVTSFVVSLSNY